MDVPCVVNGSIVEALRSHPPLPSLTCPLRKDVLVRYRLGRGIPSLSLLSFVGDLLLRALAMESDPCCWSEISFFEISSNLYFDPFRSGKVFPRIGASVPSYLEDMIEPGLFGLSRAMACGVDNFSAMKYEVTLT